MVKNKFTLERWVFLLVLGLVVFAFLYKVGEVPMGIFCDEAEVGLVAHKFLDGEMGEIYIPPFFYKHANYILGMLPVLIIAPVIWVLGMTEMSVRLASVIAGILGLFGLQLVGSRFKLKFYLPLIMLTFSPLFWLVTRISFGHGASFLMVSLGLVSWYKMVRKYQWRWGIMTGLLMGLSCYGYSGYIIGTPLLIASLVVVEVFKKRFEWRAILGVWITCLVFGLSILPMVNQFVNNPDYSSRLREKNGDKPVNIKEELPEYLKNYPKYFEPTFLFMKAEFELPGGFITRHGIKGHGIYLKVFAPVLVVAWLGMLFAQDKKKSEYLPYFIFFLLAPIPDLLTTSLEAPPYGYSQYLGLITVPFLTAYAIRVLGLVLNKQKLRMNLIQGIFIVLVGAEIGILLRDYYVEYPKYSADYWGWQYGPKEIFKYFDEHKQEYDELIMTGYFNHPEPLFDFYNYQYKCEKCFLGGVVEKYDVNKKQLFAVRTDELKTIEREYVTRGSLLLPNNQAGYFYIEIVAPTD